MTKQEFENRTLVNVSFDEYEHIEAVYLASDLDKDEFCKMWCKMNKSRVNKAKEAIKETKRIESMSLIDYAIEIIENIALKQKQENECELPLKDIRIDIPEVKKVCECVNDFIIYFLLRPTGATVTTVKACAEHDFNSFHKGVLYKLDCVDLGYKNINIRIIGIKR